MDSVEQRVAEKLGFTVSGNYVMYPVTNADGGQCGTFVSYQEPRHLLSLWDALIASERSRESLANDMLAAIDSGECGNIDGESALREIVRNHFPEKFPLPPLPSDTQTREEEQ